MPLTFLNIETNTNQLLITRAVCVCGEGGGGGEVEGEGGGRRQQINKQKPPCKQGLPFRVVAKHYATFSGVNLHFSCTKHYKWV